MNEKMKVAILIPCKNEESTISPVITGFQKTLPDAVIYVYDNASTDQTADKAREAGAIVVFEPTPGKGHVVRRMFADVEADVFVLVDGDSTYDPGESVSLIETLLNGNLDMVTGARSPIIEGANRRGHLFGNKIFNRLYRLLFGSEFSDILTGYRVFSRRLVKSFPSVSTGFEIETEIAVHTSQLGLPVLEVPVSYASRPEGSTSKLRTVSDGFRIFRAMLVLLKENRPLLLFGSLSATFLAVSAVLSVPLVATFVDTGLVPRLPTAILIAGLTVLSLLFLALGLILDSVTKGRVELKRLAYLQISKTKI